MFLSSKLIIELVSRKADKDNEWSEPRPATRFSTTEKSQKYLTFAERFFPKRVQRDTRYGQFMTDNPQRKSYSRRLKDPDSFYIREMHRSKIYLSNCNLNYLMIEREIAINDYKSSGEAQDRFAPMGSDDGLIVNSKSKITAYNYDEILIKSFM